MEKKTILLVTQGFPFGESERGFLTAEFAKLTESFRVLVVAVGTKEPLIYELPEGVLAERFSYASFSSVLKRGSAGMIFSQLKPQVLQELRWIKKEHASAKLSCLAKSALAYSMNAWQISRVFETLITRYHVDIIYTYWCTAATLAAVRLKKKHPKLKVVTRLHRFELYENEKADGYQPFRREIAEKIDRLVFIADEGRQYFLNRWGTQWSQKSVLAYLGCRKFPAVTPAPLPPLVLVSCSYVIPVKRVERIIEALALLPDDISVQWHHIGGGSELEKMRAYAEDCLSPHKNICWDFTGQVPNAEIPALYQQLNPHLFVTSSASEGLPVSVQEAFSAGIPVIATNVGGMAEIVQNGKTGYLLSPEGKAADIADAISAFYHASPAERSRLGQNASALWAVELDVAKNAADFSVFLNSL